MLNAHRPEIEQFVEHLFRYADVGTYVSLRAFDQKDRGRPALFIEGVTVGDTLDNVIDAAERLAQRTANIDPPAVFAPPVATFSDPKRARTVDVANGVAISVDVDSGNTTAAQEKLEAIIGPVTLSMASGGEWTDPETGEIHQKLHLHWRLSEPTRTPEEHGRLQHARWLAAVLVGVDRTAAPPAHPLRWPGSWNRKGAPKMAMVLSADDRKEVHLEEAITALEEAVEAAGVGEDTSPRVSGAPQADVGLIVSAMAVIPNADVHWDGWIRMGMAAYAATGGAPEGLAAWEEWSAKSGKFVDGACRERWAHFAGSPPGRIGAGTIFYMAAREGWKRPLRAFGQEWGSEPPPGQEGDPGPQPDDNGAHGANDHRQQERGGQQDRKGKKAFIWPDPLDIFLDDLSGMPRLREEHVPPALWGFVVDTAERMGVDPASVFLVGIATCSSVINDAWTIQPKRNDWSWTEQARVWVLIVGDPSILKSPVLTACTKPIVVLEIKARERHDEAMRIYRQDLAAAKADKMPEPRYPKLDRYMVESTTVEALSEVLRADDEAKMRAPAGKVLVRQDEMSEFFANLDRYKAGGKGGGDRGTEQAGGSYARQPISFSDAVRGVSVNSTPYTFGGGSAATIAGRAIYDAPTGGNLLLVIPLATAVNTAPFDAGDIGSLKITMTALTGFQTARLFNGALPAATAVGTSGDGSAISTGAKAVIRTGLLTAAFPAFDASSAGVVVQTTGFSVATLTNQATLVVTGAGTLASGSVTLPSAPLDGQSFRLGCAVTVTALTVAAPSGKTLVGSVSTCGASQGHEWLYVAGTNTWYTLF